MFQQMHVENMHPLLHENALSKSEHLMPFFDVHIISGNTGQHRITQWVLHKCQQQ